MPDRPLYLLPFRAVVLALLGVFLLGLAGGSLGAFLVVSRLLGVTPGGERVIERVERVTIAAEDALASAAAAVGPNTAVILDEQDRIQGSAVAVTQDGILVSAGPVPKGSLRVRSSTGSTVSVSVVRIYPEIGLAFLRASQAFQAPTIEREAPLAPGTALAVVAPVLGGTGTRVRIVTVEAEQLTSGEVRARYRGLGVVPTIAAPLPPSFRGAPAVGTDGQLRGVVVIEGERAFLVRGDVLDVLLQDFLLHQEETVVEVLLGLRGDWRFESRQDQEALVFRVAEISPGSAFAPSGLRSRDEILELGGKQLVGSFPLFGPLLRAAREQASVVLGVRRAGETVTVQVTPTL